MYRFIQLTSDTGLVPARAYFEQKEEEKKKRRRREEEDKKKTRRRQEEDKKKRRGLRYLRRDLKVPSTKVPRLLPRGRGLDYDDRFASMVENVIVMEDLTDDENSPTHAMTEQQVLDLTLQCQQAFEMALQSDVRQ
eukprot:s116_g42.t1